MPAAAGRHAAELPSEVSQSKHAGRSGRHDDDNASAAGRWWWWHRDQSGDHVPGGYDGHTAELHTDQGGPVSGRPDRHATKLRHACGGNLPGRYDGDAAKLCHACGNLPVGYHGHTAELQSHDTSWCDLSC